MTVTISRPSTQCKRYKALAFGLCLFALLSCSAAQSEPTTDRIKIASFNLEVFGPTKAGNAAVLGIMGEIIRQFDIVAVQEIRDASGTAVIALKSAINSTGNHYDYEIGPRLGRTTSKEQYAFFYNTATIEALAGAYTYDEGGTDTFEREPYVARFRVKSGNFDFALIDIHTKPEDATAEITYLPNVISQTTAITGEPDVICLGDFNADGSYFDEGSYLSIFPASIYDWLIPNTADTTVASSSNTYDRMVTLHSTDEDLTGSSGVFRYDQVIDMGSTLPGDISDHYPIWAEFWTNKDSD
jgi:endonuclease/exonuclease/phosphatase family metal-dependent hydrolase